MGKRKSSELTWSHNSDTTAIHSILQYTDRVGLTLIEVMGYTAHAFRMIIDRQEVEVGSYSFFDWKSNHAAAFSNLGLTVKSTGQQTNEPPTPEEWEEGLHFIQESIDKGVPALSWDLFIPEWGVIYGYDDDKKLLRCRDVRKDGELPYEKLGRGEVTELYVMTVTGSRPVDRKTMLSGALRMAVDHARNQAFPSQNSHRNGLAAYDAWTEAFTNRSVNAFGNCVNAGKISDSREFASAFLAHIVSGWEGNSLADQELRAAAQEASYHYGKVADRLCEVFTMFPFPRGGEPNVDEQANQALTLLREAKSEEEQGVRILERMLELLEQA
ncbi:hypothetical protein [Paenibacillus sp. V4I5]|uniref:hypothetical protein n=1 Tax=Paenibacillus sp. V4I5 TaxID=3042306 RepID=UPI00278DB142|nr:hypothetical protein [Paenibacillus sp. V4I5]MDQ0914741.1 hypothetical protein [Paenibacillus sp. V4I5]